MHVEPYTPAARLAKGKRGAAFRTKPHIALELIEKAQTAGIKFEAIVADCWYGENKDLEMTLRERGLPHVLARRGNATGGWALADAAFTFREAAQNVPKSAWQAVQRRFRDGHVEVWWAAELTMAGYGPGKRGRAVCATTDRNTLPEISTWYLTTNLAHEQVPLSEIVRLYGLRNWVEQSCKQMKDELGWADFMVRKEHAIRRHWGMRTAAGVSATGCGIRTESRRRRRGGKKMDAVKTTPCWTRSLRAVRAWLAPAHWLARCWATFSAAPPPPELAALIGAVRADQGINLYLRI